MDTAMSTRANERLCAKCNQWLHHSRFRSHKGCHGSMTTRKFRPWCRACEQKERNEQRNEDRALAIIRARTAERARTIGVPKAFLWDDMQWSDLVWEFRHLMSPDGRCRSCGHPFDHERDIQIEHIEPPRYPGDFAREHRRNLVFLCQPCNKAKGCKSYATSLDEQETARISNHEHPTAAVPEPTPDEGQQGSLF